jgi:hypothetical protein
MNNNDDSVGVLRTMVRSAYDLQKLRVQMGNRLCATFKSKLGVKPGTKESETLDKEEQKILKELRMRFDKLTTGVTKALPAKNNWRGDGVITTYTEACLIAEYLALERFEESQFRLLNPPLDQFPIYNEFLLGVKGCGPAMSAVIITSIDIARSTYPSSIWKFAGLDVVAGAGRSRRSEHLRTVKYVNKDGEEAERRGITFNPFLKTKLIGVLAPCLIKAKSEPYAQIYGEYKHRLENHPKWVERSKGHRHNAAMRYMVKCFLVDLYIAWRRLAGLEVHPAYAEAKLGIIHKKVPLALKSPATKERAEVEEPPETLQRAELQEPPNTGKRAKKRKPPGQI